MRLALVCFYCLCVFVYVLYFIATMSFAGYFLPVLFCMLSMLISDSRFDLVWFRLSCDHGWIRSNVRKQQQQQQQQLQHTKKRVTTCANEIPDWVDIWFDWFLFPPGAVYCLDANWNQRDGSRQHRLCVQVSSGVVYKYIFISYMYVCMVITYSRVWINRVRLPILPVVSWTGKMISPVPVRAWEFGLARRVMVHKMYKYPSGIVYKIIVQVSIR